MISNTNSLLTVALALGHMGLHGISSSETCITAASDEHAVCYPAVSMLSLSSICMIKMASAGSGLSRQIR